MKLFMAKPKKDAEALKELLLARIPALFERDPRAAIVDALLDELVADILK